MENVFHWVDGEESMTSGILKHHNLKGLGM